LKILIIGGTGQISQVISRLFLDAGDDLTLYNRGKTKIHALCGYKTIHGDRKDLATFERLLGKAGPFDCVIDMICFEPEDAESLIRIFGGQIGQLILCSTAAVYQRPASRYPITEAEPLLATSSYGRNKAHCERILFEAQEQGHFNVTVLRPANTYGPGGDLIYTLGWGNGFLDRIRKGKALVSPGDGSSLRAYCHAEDVARAFVSAAGNQKAFGRAYHITGERWLTWDQYFEVIAGAMSVPLPRLVHIPCDVLHAMAPDRLADVIENYQFNNIFDNQAAHTDLNFLDTVNISEGMQQTINWLEDNKRIYESDGESLDDAVIAAWDVRHTGYPLNYASE
jgi:nucleoside-diphosphate-sugar epimerase